MRSIDVLCALGYKHAKGRRCICTAHRPRAIFFDFRRFDEPFVRPMSRSITSVARRPTERLASVSSKVMSSDVSADVVGDIRFTYVIAVRSHVTKNARTNAPAPPSSTFCIRRSRVYDTRLTSHRLAVFVEC